MMYILSDYNCDTLVLLTMQYIVNAFSFNPLKADCFFTTDVIVQQLKNNPGNIVAGIKTCLFQQQTELYHIYQDYRILTQTNLHINYEVCKNEISYLSSKGQFIIYGEHWIGKKVTWP